MVVGSFTPVMIVSMAAVIVAVTMAMLVASWKERRRERDDKNSCSIKERMLFLSPVGWLDGWRVR